VVKRTIIIIYVLYVTKRFVVYEYTSYSGLSIAFMLFTDCITHLVRVKGRPLHMRPGLF